MWRSDCRYDQGIGSYFHTDCVSWIQVNHTDHPPCAASAINSICRARKLRESLKIQSQAVTVIAAHVRSFLQKKRYLEIKRRHYAAIKIQAVFRCCVHKHTHTIHRVLNKLFVYRGYRERVIYKVKQAEAQEREKKQKKLEDFAQLVQKHKETLAPFPTKSPGFY